MNVVLTSAILLISYSIAAQTLVSDALAEQKAKCDSLLQLQYGSELYKNFMVLDSSSGGYFVNSFQTWNMHADSDSASYYWIRYYFKLPGTHIDSSNTYEFFNGQDNEPTRGSYGAVCYQRKLNITADRLAMLVQDTTGNPLSLYKVGLFEYREFSDSLSIILDSTHLYLAVRCDSIVYSGFQKRRFKLYQKKIVVDAFDERIISISMIVHEGRCTKRRSSPNCRL